MFWVCEFTLSYFLVQFFVILASEGKLSAQHRKQENAGRPDISRWSYILFFHNNFRAHVRRRAAEHFQLGFTGGATTKSKVNQFDDPSVVNYDVLQLDIPVCHITLMQVRQHTY